MIPGRGDPSFLEEDAPEWVGAHLLRRALRLSPGVPSAAETKQARLGTNRCDRHYPQDPKFLSLSVDNGGSSGVFGVGGGSTAGGIQLGVLQPPRLNPRTSPGWDKPQVL